MNLAQRFQTSRNTTRDKELICFLCPYAEKLQKGKVGREYFEYRPNLVNGQCQNCYDEWFEEKTNSGRICLRCRQWVGREKAGIVIETEFTKRAICVDCALEIVK